MNKKALRNLLKERRALVQPEGHGFERPTGQGRRAPGLTQHQVDQLCHVSLGTYRRLESGAYPNPPVDFLRDVAVLFALNEQEWRSLCRYAGIGDPPAPLNPRSGKEVPGVWQEAVDGITHMAYVTDASWELIAHNAPFARLFPNGRVPTNTMRWMLFDPDGRNTLTDWATTWAPLVLPNYGPRSPHDPTTTSCAASRKKPSQTRTPPRSGTPAAPTSTPTATNGPSSTPRTGPAGSRCAQRSP